MGLHTSKRMNQREDRSGDSVSRQGFFGLPQNLRSLRGSNPLRYLWSLRYPPLSRVELDDELLIYDRSDFLATWDSGHFALELVLIDDKPIRDWLDLRQFKVASCQAT